MLPPNHTANRCMLWVMTCTSMGVGCGEDRGGGGREGGGEREKGGRREGGREKGEGGRGREVGK